jgi:hypothetical protein
VAQITDPAATCSQFAGGSAQTLAAIHYTIRNGRIASRTPSGLRYWVSVTRPAGSNTAVVSQAITSGNFSTLFGLTTGSRVYNASCVAVSGATFTAGSGNGSFTAQWNAASAGTYYVSLKLTTANVKSQPAPTPPTVHYQYATSGVTGSTTGVDLTSP